MPLISSLGSASINAFGRDRKLRAAGPSELSYRGGTAVSFEATPYTLVASTSFSNDFNRLSPGYTRTLSFNEDGWVKFKLWGAAGGDNTYSGGNPGGAGGYVEGEVYVTAGTTYYLVIGHGGWTGSVQGKSGSGGFGGGGTTHTDNTSSFGNPSSAYGIAGASSSHGRNAIGAGGGGATALFHTAVAVGNELLVAGGGGGGGYSGGVGGAGGGSVGEDATDGATNGGTGGTQSAGGSNPAGTTGDGARGIGGRGEGRGGGGGSGYWGGGGGADGNPAGGGGGSSYYSPNLSLVRNAATYAGVGTTPGNAADADRPTRAGEPYWVTAADTDNTYGGPGACVIRYVANQSSGGGSSGYSIDVSSGGLSVSSVTGSNFGTGDFTLEAWVKPASLAAQTWHAIVGHTYASSGGMLYVKNDGSVDYYDGGSILNTGASTVADGIWYHIAAVRNSGNLKIYVNGTAIATTTYTNNITDTNVYVGQNQNGNERLNGYLAYAHMLSSAKYTANFTPATSIGSSASSLILASAANGIITDQSGNGYTFTNNGATVVSSGP